MISFDLNNGKPLGAIAIGNLDTAKNVTWNIPGMGTTVDDGMESWGHSAQDLYNGQKDAYDSLYLKDPGHAVVAWIGYDTPEKPPEGSQFLNPVKDVEGTEVLKLDKAQAGSQKLAAALDGFYATRWDGNSLDQPKNNVVAHSYGTTTSAYALTKTHYPVDTVTFFASAGIDLHAVTNAAAMNVAKVDGQPAVYATQAFDDRVAPYAGIGGSDLLGIGTLDPKVGRFSPQLPGWGAHSFSSDGGYDPQTGVPYKMVTGHDAQGHSDKFSFFSATTGHGYLDPGTESSHNIALTSIGHGDSITPLVPLHQTLPSGIHLDPWETISDESKQDPATLGKPRG